MIIGIYNHKGGVGKTTVTVNLAYEFAKMGKSVAVVDLDGQCNTTNFFDLANKDVTISDVFTSGTEISRAIYNTRYSDIAMVPCDKRADDLIDSFANGECGTQEDVVQRISSSKEYLNGNYDIILVDFPPQFSTVTKLFMMLLCDKMLVVSTLDVQSIEGIQSINEFLYETGIESIGVVINLFEGTTTEEKTIAALENVGIKIFPTKVHRQNGIRTAYRNGKCLTEMYSTFVTAPKRKEFKTLANEIANMV